MVSVGNSIPDFAPGMRASVEIYLDYPLESVGAC